MNDLTCEKTCIESEFNCLEHILSKKEFDLLKNEVSYLEYSANETIIRQGDFVSKVIYIKEGFVKKVLEGICKRDLILKIINHGNLAGLTALGNSKTYPFSIISITPCKVCLINIEYLREIMHQNNKFKDYLINGYLRDYHIFYKHFTKMSFLNRYGKVANALLYLSKLSNAYNILKFVSRKDIAELSTLSVDSSNKILQSLNNEGIIHIKNESIHIKKIEQLRQLSNIG